jgi:hypothetical protein
MLEREMLLSGARREARFFISALVACGAYPYIHYCSKDRRESILYELLFVSISIPFFLYNYLENNDNKRTVMM